LEKFKPDLLPVCADCRSTSLDEQAKPAHATSVGNPWSIENLNLNGFGRSFGDISKLSQ